MCTRSRNSLSDEIVASRRTSTIFHGFRHFQVIFGIDFIRKSLSLSFVSSQRVDGDGEGLSARE